MNNNIQYNHVKGTGWVGLELSIIFMQNPLSLKLMMF